VKFLIENGANQDAEDINKRKASHFAMIKAVKKNATEEEKAQVKYFGDDVRRQFREDFRMTPIHACVLHLQEDQEEGDSTLLFELLQLVEEVNNNQNWSGLYSEYSDRSPLFTDILNLFEMKAVQLRESNRGHEPIFLDLRNQPDAHNWTPLYWAAFAGRFHEMKTLLRDNIETLELTTSRRNILHAAAESGDPDLFGYLFEEQNSLLISTMDINQKDLWGETPLHIAATRSVRGVLFLIDNGAKVDLVQEEHQTALHFACQAAENDMRDIVDVLTQRCPSLIKMKDNSGRTPIFELLRSPGCVKLLLDRGADVNDRDHKSRSLLHEACSRGHPEALEIIMTRCERKLITGKDDAGLTPLAAAFACSTPESALALGCLFCCPTLLGSFGNVGLLL
jgi:ankyrin repeat protein